MDFLTYTAAAAAFASAAAYFSYRVARSSLRTERRRYAASLLGDLTTGEVAQARNVLGTWLYGPHERHSQVQESDLIQSYYTVAWAIERLAAGRSALGVLRFTDRRTVISFDARISWHVQEQAANLKTVARYISMDNAEVALSLQALKSEIPDLDMEGPAARTLTCDHAGCRPAGRQPEELQSA